MTVDEILPLGGVSLWLPCRGTLVGVRKWSKQICRPFCRQYDSVFSLLNPLQPLVSSMLALWSVVVVDGANEPCGGNRWWQSIYAIRFVRRGTRGWLDSYLEKEV
jgi:hypothetical protein